MNTDPELFDELAVAANNLVPQVDGMLSMLPESQQPIVFECLQALKQVLNRCHIPAYAGELLDEHLEIKYFRADMQPSTEEARGVEVRHRFANITVKVYNNPTRAQNLESAKKYIADRLK